MEEDFSSDVIFIVVSAAGHQGSFSVPPARYQHGYVAARDGVRDRVALNVRHQRVGVLGVYMWELSLLYNHARLQLDVVYFFSSAIRFGIAGVHHRVQYEQEPAALLHQRLEHFELRIGNVFLRVEEHDQVAGLDFVGCLVDVDRLQVVVLVGHVRADVAEVVRSQFAVPLHEVGGGDIAQLDIVDGGRHRALDLQLRGHVVTRALVDFVRILRILVEHAEKLGVRVGNDDGAGADRAAALLILP